MSKTRSRTRGRRRTVPASSDSPSPSGDYWKEFLKAKGFIGLSGASSEAETGSPSPPAPGEGKVLFDPMFSKFLYYASQYGAPGSVAEFRKLPVKDKVYYLKAYEEWLKNIRLKRIKV
jgi:hypothetical protein